MHSKVSDKRCPTYVQCYYTDLHGDAHKDGRSLLTRVFGAKEKRLARSSGIAPGLLSISCSSRSRWTEGS